MKKLIGKRYFSNSWKSDSKRSVIEHSPWIFGNTDPFLIKPRKDHNAEEVAIYQQGLEENVNGLRDGLEMTFNAFH